MELTEKEFEELYEICLLWDDDFSLALQKAKDNGWVEKNAVDEFIECFISLKLILMTIKVILLL